MKEVDLEKLKAQIPERAFDRLHDGSGMFEVAYSAGQARSLWNLTIAAADAEVDDFESIYRMAEESHDLAHLCGLHKFRWRKSKWHELRQFWSFIWHDPRFVDLKNGLRGYIEHVCENSRSRFGRSSKPLGLLEISPRLRHLLGDAQDLRLPWRSSEWFKTREDRKRASRIVYEPLTEFYPYIAKSPTEEHDLLLAVDRAVGRRLPEEWRGDFCQDLIVSILSGDLAVENLDDELPNYLKLFKREMPNKYRTLSIDAPIYGEGRTLAETLADPSVQDMAASLAEAWEANRCV